MGTNRIMAAVLVGAVLLAAPARAAQSPAPDKPAADRTYEQLELLVDVLGYIQDNYVTPVDTQKLIYGAAEGMVGTLDPFSQFLDPEMNKEMKTETEGQFGGVGLRLVREDGGLSVLTPMSGTPAYRAGILPNDLITAIDGKSTKDVDLEGALKLLRGAPGTKVTLQVLRAGADGGPGRTLTFAITRELIKVDSVVSKELDDGVGYARVTEFTAKTADDLSSALTRLRREGMTSLVLDLRNNPGGLLSAAVETSSLFLGENRLIVYTQGRDPKSRQDFTAGAKAPYEDLPFVILINGGSASAAEIFTGAMQDHKRAVVIGQRSYGKASVQSLIPLSDGSGLRLTVAHYYTPDGRMINRDGKNPNWGIEPDIAVDVAPAVEAKLYAQWETIYAKNKKPRSAVEPQDRVPDEVLNRAVELLKARAALSSLQVGAAPPAPPAP
jgi:carboxyl-terminal processing protease